MKCHSNRSLFAALAAVTCVFGIASSAKSAELSAGESDPKAMGWMTGFPPPADKLIGQPDSNYFSFPKLRWTVCHLREFLPTKVISRGLGTPATVTRADDPNIASEIDAVKFKPIGSDTDMTWRESLAANYTDGMLVLHRGRIVYEKYFGCLGAAGKHGAMSMTKSMTGLLAEILVAEGKLDDKALVSSIIPELKDSAFGSATVRQVMDMTTALDFSEDYSDPKAGIWAYAAAANPLPKPADYKGPIGYYAYLQTLQQKGTHGDTFGYKTVNSDALGWIIARTTGRSMADFFSDRIWSKVGAEQDSYITIDALGTPFAGGGLSAGLRDLGRIGLLMLNEGKLNGQQIFPAAAVKSIKAGGSKVAFEKGGFKTLPGGSYRGMWWVFHNDHGAFAARGVHGQTIYVDPTADMVIVRFASHPQAKNAYIDPTSLPAYQAVAEYLVKKKAASSLRGNWKIDSLLDAEKLDTAKTELAVMDDGRWGLTIGCNRLMTKPVIKGTSVLIGPIASSRKACRPVVARLERRLQLALGAARSLNIAKINDQLDLRDANGSVVISFSRNQ
jgi:CubicO group peptidase (beta-lactamase class C family)